MKTKKTLGILPIVAIVMLVVGFASCDSAGLFGGGGSGYKVSVAPDSVSVFLVRPGVAEEGVTVTVYARTGRPTVTSESGADIPVSGGEGVSDQGLLDDLGFGVAYAYTFVMPGEPVTVYRPSAVGGYSGLLRSVKFEYSNRPSDGINVDNGGSASVSIVQGDQIYGDSSKPYWVDGAPQESIRVRKVTPGLDIKVTPDVGTGVSLKYRLDGFETPALNSSVEVYRIANGGQSVLEIIVEKDGETVIFPYRFTTSSLASDNADLSELKIFYGDGEKKTAAYADLQAVAVAGTKGSVEPEGFITFEFPYETKVVRLRAVTVEAAALLESGGGRIISGTEYEFWLAGVGEENPNDVPYKVVAEDNEHAKAYKVRLIRKLSDDCSLKNVKIDALGGYGFNKDILAYDLKNNPVYAIINAVTITPIANDPIAVITWNDGSDGAPYNVNSDGSQPFMMQLKKTGTNDADGNELVFNVTAQNGASRQYSFKIYRNDPTIGDSDIAAAELVALSVLPNILDLSGGKKNFDLAAHPYSNITQYVTVRVAVGAIQTSTGKITATVNSAGTSSMGITKVIEATDEYAEIEVPLTSYGVGDGNGENIMITMRGGREDVVYTVRVYRSAGEDASLTSLKMLNAIEGSPGFDVMSGVVTPSVEGNITTYDLEDQALWVPNHVKSFELVVEAQDPMAVIYVNGSKMVKDGQGVKKDSVWLQGFGEGTPTIVTVKVVSQSSASEKLYCLYVYRVISSDTTLRLLSSSKGAISNFQPTNRNYALNDETSPLLFIDNPLTLTIVANNEYANIVVGASGSNDLLGNNISYEWYLRDGSDSSVFSDGINITVVAQNGIRGYYTLIVYRDFDRKNNTNLQEIYAVVAGEDLDGTSKTQARVYPYFDKDHPKDGYKLYSPYLAAGTGEKTITIGATGLLGQTGLNFDAETITFKFPQNTPVWTEYKLPTPATITVTANDGVTTKTYSVTHVVLTPGITEKRTPIAKGGTVSFLEVGSGADKRWEEIHDFKPSANNVTLESNLEYLAYSSASDKVVSKRGRLLVQGGGGAGGSGFYISDRDAMTDAYVPPDGNDGSDGGDAGSNTLGMVAGGGGGGGGAGYVHADNYFHFDRNSFAVIAGKGGGTTEDGNKQSEAGTASKFGGVSGIIANGGTGGFKGGFGQRDKMPSGRIITGNTGSDVSFFGATYNDDKWQGNANGGGIGGESVKVIDVGLFLLELGGIPFVSLAFSFVLVVLTPIPAGGVIATGLVIGLLVGMGLVVSGSMIYSYCVGGFGGGGAYSSGAKGSFDSGLGGSGGSGKSSDILGTSSFEYGKGGKGADSADLSGSYAQGVNGKDAEGGNAEYIQSGERAGGAGRVIARFTWE